MKQPLLLIVIILLLHSCKEDTVDLSIPASRIPPYSTINGHTGTWDNSVIVSSDNNLVFSGGNGIFFISKVSKSGNVIWYKNYFHGINTHAGGIAELNQCYFAAGKMIGNQPGLLLIKYNADGDTLWSKLLHGHYVEGDSYIIKTSDGNLLICYSDYQNINLVKLDQDGNYIWSKGYPATLRQVAFNILETQGGYLVTGKEYSSTNVSYLYYMKVDYAGDTLWTKSYFSSGWGFSTIELANGDIVTTGGGLFVMKMDQSGNKIWERNYNSVFNGMGSSVKQDPDGNFTLTGFQSIPSGINTCIQRIDSDGNLIWNKRINQNHSFSATSILKDNEDNIITGNLGADKIFMLRMDKNGNYK